jgi:hypothetical protein
MNTRLIGRSDALEPCHPKDEPSMRRWRGEAHLTGRVASVAVFDAWLWHAVTENRTNTGCVTGLVRYAPWWLNLDCFAAARWIITTWWTATTTAPPPSREQFESLPDAAKTLLHYPVS